ncbi:hypothetical protein RZS08_53385, partial [Arthrospira platensis SPKY1]|nr:hypothetical protein [Arthrospira platensis SPKY1]
HRLRAMHCCSATQAGRAQPRCASGTLHDRPGEQLGHRQYGLGHVDEAAALVHRRLPQQTVGLLLAQALVRHQQALGALDELALVERRAHRCELIAHRLQPARLDLQGVE